MKDQTFKATYFFGKDHMVAGLISAKVEQVVQKQYPALNISIVQDCFNPAGSPLHTMRVTGQGLKQSVVKDILA